MPNRDDSHVFHAYENPPLCSDPTPTMINEDATLKARQIKAEHPDWQLWPVVVGEVKPIEERSPVARSVAMAEASACAPRETARKPQTIPERVARARKSAATRRRAQFPGMPTVPVEQYQAGLRREHLD